MTVQVASEAFEVTSLTDSSVFLPIFLSFLFFYLLLLSSISSPSFLVFSPFSSLIMYLLFLV